MNQREQNYDLLRSMSAIMVVLLHIGSFYQFSAIPNYSVIGTCLQAVTRTAVPCFVMISGAFLLSDERWKTYEYTLKKTKKSILAPTIGYSVLFILLSCFTYILGVSDSGFGEIFYLTLQGYPYPHMWYMFVCSGLYLMTPLLWYLKESFLNMGKKQYAGLILLLLVLGSIAQGLTGEPLVWIVRIPTFIGYFMLGDLIRAHYVEKKRKRVSWIALVAWVVCIGVSCWIQLVYPDWNPWGGLHTDPLNPLVIIASVGCFVFFSSLSVKWDTSSFGKHTSRIYLIHILPLQILKVLIEKINEGNLLQPIVGIPLMFIVTLGTSLLYSIIVNRVKSRWKLNWL